MEKLLFVLLFSLFIKAQTVYVDSDKDDSSECGNFMESACKTFAYGFFKASANEIDFIFAGGKSYVEESVNIGGFFFFFMLM